MKARILGFWRGLAARFDGLARRERAMVAAAAIGGVLLGGQTLLVDPVSSRNASLRQDIERQRGELAALQVQLVTQEALLRADPDAGKKAEVAALQESLRHADRQLEALEAGLVQPERMNAVLENLLRRHPGLRLVSFKTLPPEPLLEPSAKDDAKAPARDFNVFRHGVEIRLEGGFADLHAYVAQLEQGPQKFLWGEMSLAVTEYPKSQLTLVVYTLGSDKAWLAI